MVSAAADEIDDLDGVALVDDRVGERVPANDIQVVFDGDAPRIDVEPGEEIDHRDRLVELVALAVEGDHHAVERTAVKEGESR